MRNPTVHRFRVFSYKTRNTVTWQDLMKLKQGGSECVPVRRSLGTSLAAQAYRPSLCPRVSPAGACHSWAVARGSLPTLAHTFEPWCITFLSPGVPDFNLLKFYLCVQTSYKCECLPCFLELVVSSVLLCNL